MNNRERKKIHTICKFKIFEGFNLIEYLTSIKFSNKKSNKKYVKMLMKNYRKWYEGIVYKTEN